MRLVIDTNEIISAIIKEGLTREIIVSTNFDLLTPAHTLTEINKYKEEILRKSRLDENDFFILLKDIFSYVRIINPLFYSDRMNEANELIGHIHITDVPFLACALAFGCPIWSDDKHFKMQNKIEVYPTHKMAGFLEEE